jgi:CBS domain-containing protein
MKIGDIMTRQVLAIGPDTPLLQAVRLMTAHHVSGVPVVGPSGELVGILTEGDLLRRAETGTAGTVGWLTHLLSPGREAQDYVLTHGRRTEEVMTSDVVTVTEETPLAEAVHLMQRYKVKRLPVVRDGKLLGIVSRADLIRHLGALLPAAAGSADDEAIRQALLTAIEKEPWASRNMAQITVTDGVVHLDGCLFDIRERLALEVVAENIPGVKKVENRIVCIEPYTATIVYDPATETNSAIVP